MPVSKHRRRSQIRTRKPDPSPDAARQDAMTLDELRHAIANPARDFSAKTIVAGVWWFQELLRRVGDRWHSMKASRKDKKEAALLLCVAMDGAHGKNDDLSPILANMLRPYCPAATFTEAWEQANQMSRGTARETAAKILGPSDKSVT
ncbi:MAG: hypothetical protein QOH05_707 [Acetobacteraceae bacterium]|nr:hypothetical protein [Acetobacteraceae bacterium]